MSEKLNFGNAGNDPLSGYDAAPDPNDFDLSGFDAATGKTTVPPGNYVCRIERGELTKTKSGKQAYKFRFVVVEPAEHTGFTTWKWFLLTDQSGFNRLKATSSPFGLVTSAHLRECYPPRGREVYAQCLITHKDEGPYGPSNDVQRFEPCLAPETAKQVVLNPFAVSFDETEGSNSQ